MGRRFTYSRWDGTQRVLAPDSDDILAEVTDEVIHHGDVAAALRRIMHGGLDRGDGRDIEGLRSMIERLRQRRAELAKGDPGGMFTRLNEQLDDILDEERLAIDRLRPTDGDRADSRALQLDLLPDALAARIEELRTYDFVSDEAKRRFDALLDGVREQIMQRHVDQISGAMQQLDDAQLAEIKDMLATLNDMLARHGRGEDPQFEAFMERFGAHFPENPASLDELLELLARRMAAARSVLNAMSPEQREQLRELSEQLLGDMDLRWQMDQLADNLQSMYPDLGWNDAAEFSGGDPLSMRDALRAAEEIGRLQDLEAFLSRAAAPGQLADVDLDAVARHLGDDSADSLRRLAGLADSLAEAGLIDTTEGRLELTARGLRQIGNNALREIFGRLGRDVFGGHRLDELGTGLERAEDTKPYEFGDPFHLDLRTTLRNSLRRGGAGVPIELHPDDFEVERTEHQTRSSTVLMVDLSLSMPMRDNFLPAKKVAVALHALISSRFPRDYLGIVGFSEVARVLNPVDLPAVSWDFVYGTNMQHGLRLARQLLAGKPGTRQIVMITDGEPTAHVMDDGEVFFHYPPVYETVEATMREVARCTRDGIRINTFMLDATTALRDFIEKMARFNGGRAFFASSDTLGEYVLIDFLDGKRHERSRRSSRRAG